MRRILICVAMMLSLCSMAQQYNKTTFHSYNAVGFLAGKSPVALTAQTVNGVALHDWFIGAGFGIDDYRSSSLPLFLDIKKLFTIQQHKLFLYADGGTHFIIKREKIDDGFWEISAKGKIYLDAGVGALIKAGKKNHFFFTVGNSLKTIEERERSPDIGFPFSRTTKYRLNRLSLRAGFQL